MPSHCIAVVMCSSITILPAHFKTSGLMMLILMMMMMNTRKTTLSTTTRITKRKIRRRNNYKYYNIFNNIFKKKSAHLKRISCLPYAGFFSAGLASFQSWLIYWHFKASALWANAFYKLKCLSICLCVHFWGTIQTPPLPEIGC